MIDGFMEEMAFGLLCKKHVEFYRKWCEQMIGGCSMFQNASSNLRSCPADLEQDSLETKQEESIGSRLPKSLNTVKRSQSFFSINDENRLNWNQASRIILSPHTC